MILTGYKATGLDVRDNKYRAATLLTCVGPEALEVFEGFEFENEDDGKHFEKIIEKFEKFCIGSTNETYERYCSNKREQEAGESIDAYVSALRTLAKTCNYTTLEDALIRDRIVIGIRDNHTRKKLLQDSKLTLNSCIDICRAAEKTSKQMKAISQEEVQMVQHKEKKESARRSQHRPEPKECRYCGTNHVFRKESCPAWGKKCSKCHKSNHFESKCRNERPKRKPSKKKRSVNFMVDYDTDSSDDFLFSVETGSTDTQKGEKKIYALGKMNGKNVKFQLDSGATVNVLPASLYKHLCGDRKLKRLINKSKPLRMFNHSVTKPVGKRRLRVVNPKNNKEYEYEFDIVDADVHPILGSLAIQEMNFITVNDDVIERGPGLVNQISENEPDPITKENIFEKFPEVFSGVGKLPGKLHLEIDDKVQPTKIPTRKISLALTPKVKSELNKLEKQKILSKVHDPTDWISAMVVVSKPSGKIRLCIDPQPLNAALKRNHYPTPTIEDMLHDLQGARLFTVLDAKNGFWHVELDHETSLLTTFATPWGRYRWNRMPFGISPAPEEFQRRLDQALEGLDGVKAIHDDIIVYGCGGSDEQALRDHDIKLVNLLQRCKEKGICINKEKIKLRLSEVTYMGHIISKHSLRADPAKVKSIVEMPTPTDKKGVQRLLGMVNYVQKFAPNLSEFTAPLRQLTHEENGFVWDETVHGKALNDIKSVLTDAPVLQYFDQNKPTILQCDASQHGLGACLLQDGHPVAYASRALTPTEQNYAQIEKELLAVVFGMERFENYTYGREILVESDHKPLEIITKKSLTSAPKRLQRMLLRLQRFEYCVLYKPGSEMYLADTLSRAYLPLKHNSDRSPNEQLFEQVNIVQNLPISPQRLKRLQDGTEEDEAMNMLTATIRKGWPDRKNVLPPQVQVYFPFREELTIQNGLIFKSDRVVIPQSERFPLIETAHQSHIGLQGCLRRLRECLYWPNMNKDVTEYIARCEVCNTFNNNQCKETLQSHEIPLRPWERVACDIFEFNQKSYLSTVDYYSDYFEIDGLHNKTEKEIIQKLKLNFARHGIPDVLVSDNGPPFSSTEFKDFVQKYEMQHITSSPYHAQANGKVENSIKTAKGLMRKAFEDSNDPYLALLEWRNTPTEGIGLSPNQRLFGRRTKSLLPMSNSLLTPSLTSPKRTISKALKKRKEKQRKYYDRNARDLKPLDEQDSVRIKPSGREKNWKLGKVVNILPHRSYEVETSYGTNIRRNRNFLKKTQEQFQPFSESEPPVDRNVLQVPEVNIPEVNIPEVEAPRIEQSQIEQTIVKQPVRNIMPPSPKVSQGIRTSGRPRNRPKYLEDFVTYVSDWW
ncbi:uncharacterized protein K02A2.6-like [Pecten maximus]|uniref:uncharacterized protein K02A2.6-like n=1 Tax=Pecten maximus TaxID=6579 RepID=UPI00145854E3|nr:uncharacterized protein K02A2.6-like [Pecten maximus]